MFNKLIFLLAIGVVFTTNTAGACPEGQKKYCVTHKKTGDVYCGCSFDPNYRPHPKWKL